MAKLCYHCLVAQESASDLYRSVKRPFNGGAHLKPLKSGNFVAADQGVGTRTEVELPNPVTDSPPHLRSYEGHYRPLP